MNKKRISIIIAILFVGIVVSLAIFPRLASAGFFDDVWGFFKSGFSSPTTSTVEKSESGTKEIPLYKPAIDYENAVVSAVEEASPSVISIVISKNLPIIEECQGNPFGDLPPEFQDFFGGRFNFSVPCEKGTKRQEVGGGSGFVISEDGLIVTNKHVVLDTKAEYTVLTNDGEKYTAKVLARDATKDLAVLKINTKGLKPVKLGNSDGVKLGQTAIAIGNALGEFRNTVSVGVISGLSRTITAGGAGGFVEKIEGVMQTDAAINQGNSGGPLLNLKGEVIGINTAVASDAQNIGFAIPINQVKRAIQSVKDTGSIKSPYIGVRYIMVTEEIAKKQKLSVSEGALIRGTGDGPGVIPDSPGDKAGLKAEDIITEVNGEKLTIEKTLGSVIQKYNIGETVTLKVYRGKDVMELSVTLKERPQE
jgi:serine protease Do